MSLSATVDATVTQAAVTARQRASWLTRFVLICGAPLRHWRTTLLTAASVLAWLLARRAGVPGWWGLIALVGFPTLFLLAWAAVDLSSFRRLAWPWLRSGWRRWLVYAPAWRLWMTRCRLTVLDEDGHTVAPALVRVDALPAVDRLVAQIPAGLTVDRFQLAADQLANAARVEECRVRRDRPGRVILDLRVRDLLALPLPMTPIGSRVDLRAGVVLGLREDGLPWRVPVLDVHRLVAGRSRSGKGSLLWGEILALAPVVSSGLVRVIGIDPKGGLELALGRQLFTRFVYQDPDQMVRALEEIADEMDDRAASLMGTARKFTPSMTTPLVLVFIDELATLTLYSGPQIGTRAEQALGRILTKGAAPGFLIRGYVQDPRKDTVPMRGLFTHRIALGLDTPGEVDMVLGDGAHDRGAHADRIPLAAKGMAFVLEDGNPEPYRVRAGYPTDEDIRQTAARFPAPQQPAVTSSGPAARPAPSSAVTTVWPSQSGGNGRTVYRPDPAVPLLPPSLLAALDPTGQPSTAQPNGGTP